MTDEWADRIAKRLFNRSLGLKGICLILGDVDTGKTTLATNLAERLVRERPVGIIDADIGQSHIGPPTTVGWAVIDQPKTDWTHLRPNGISFVGNVTPVGHLLQLTASLTQCVREVFKVTEPIIIDTPGFVSGPAATVLWWTVQRILQPGVILVVQRGNELNGTLAGMQNLGSHIELLECPHGIPTKSPEARRSHRQRQFYDYFQDSSLYHFERSNMTIQDTRNLSKTTPTGRLVGMRDSEGFDRAIGITEDWENDKDTIIVRAPKIDMDPIRCLVVGDVTVDLNRE